MGVRPKRTFTRCSQSHAKETSAKKHSPSGYFHLASHASLAGAPGVFWWHMTDFKVLPCVQLFVSLPHLFLALSQVPMAALSAEMRLQHLQRTHSTARYWQEALLKALAHGQKGDDRMPDLSFQLGQLVFESTQTPSEASAQPRPKARELRRRTTPQLT
ncbi:unnamed protein product [Durusdinium trenchii]|uniref:Uncharacterized protein n=1 Tax=Durusdinium trenchii TaxID=1381693 RepID=A0ABP0LHW6_9DINO